jgi:outer membrane protein assembly factor BamD (BamD/ComL family)
LQEGETAFHAKDYAKAAEHFKAAASRMPDSPLEEDALFMQAECQFFDDDYPEAQKIYSQLLQKHDNTRYLDTVSKRLFAIGQYWDQLDQQEPSLAITPNIRDDTRPRFDTFGNAIKAFETIRMHDPIGPLADDAVMATANAYFRKGRFAEAARHYDELRKEFSQSEHQAEAHVLGVQSKLRAYQGPAYDGTLVEEAGDIAERALTQLRHELGPEQDRLIDVRNQVIEQKAERDWTAAQYYDNKKQYGAAAQYYVAIIEEYPHTQFARQAAARLDEIRGERAEPVNRFEWLTRAFEEREERRR